MKSIPGYEGKYTISPEGAIWSNISNRFMKTQLNKMGYCVVTLVRGKGKTRLAKTHTVHRLVATTYIPNNLNKPCINHINGVKTDNAKKNLEWCTQKENVQHANRIGLCGRNRGDAHPSVKLSDKQVEEIRPRIDHKYGTLTKIAKEYGVSISLIHLIGRGDYRVSV